MGMSDLDIPLLPNADQIRRREFSMSKRGGYDTEQVREYLDSVANQVEALEEELREARLARTDAIAQAPVVSSSTGESYEELAKRLAAVIASADTESKKILEEARAEADGLLAEARGEADKVKVDAQARAEELRKESQQILDRSRLEVERTLSGLASQREGLLSELTEMRSRMLAVARDLAATIEEAGSAEVMSLPEADLAKTEVASTGSSVDQNSASEKQVVSTKTSIPPASDPSDKRGEQKDDDIIDPRYEDLWVSDGSVDLPDLTSLDIDFDEN